MAERFAPLLSSGDTELKNQASTDAMEKVTRREEEEFKPTVAGRIAAPLLDIVEKALVWAFVDKSQPNYYLSGNYAPVEETKPVSNLPVIGSLPECLNGEFMRVGPNPRFNPVGGYHWFDGDGMIHAVWIKDGKATYVSRYVKTNRLKQETYYGAAKFGKFGDVMGGKFGLLFALLSSLRVKLGVLDVSRGAGQGNTALTFHNGTLLALHEADKPYALRVLEDGDLETQGLMDYDSRLDHRFTAHPKLDPVTGELFTFGYDVEKPPPNVTYRVISKDGVLADPVHITIPEPVMMHDFAITENFAIFMDLPLIFRPKEILKSGNPFIFDSTKKARFGILPRYSRNEGQIRWFEVPSCFIFHNLNAWEEGDEIVLYTCRMESMDLKLIAVHNSDGVNNMMTELYEFRFNLKSGRASQRKLGDFFADFPRINEDYVGRKQRYGYVCVFENLKIKGVVKVDLFAEPQLGKGLAVGNNITGVFLHGNKRYGSEAVFVPSNNASAEDDGYLITFVHDENLERSEVVVIDAKTMSADPVAVVLLPSRVPYGFHANFVSEYQIKSQKRW